MKILHLNKGIRLLFVILFSLFAYIYLNAESDIAIDIKEGLKAIDQTSTAQQKVANSLAKSIIEDATGEEALDEAEVLSNAAKQSGEISAKEDSKQNVKDKKANQAASSTPLSYSEFRIENARKLKIGVEEIFGKIKPYFPDIYRFFDGKIYGVSVFCIMTAVFIILAAIIVQKYLVGLLIRLVSMPFSSENSTDIKYFLGKIINPIRAVIILIGVHTAFELIVSDPTAIVFVGTISTILFLGILFWVFGILTINMIDAVSRRFAKRYPAARDLLALSKGGIKWFLYSMFVLVSLDIVGVNVGALIATFAIGAAALAFASKDTIANFVGSIAIIIDRPFEVGDTVKIEGVEGIVESIGMRSTKIKTPQKTIIYAPNSTVASNLVDNVSKDPAEVIRQKIRISMDADADNIESIIKQIKKIVECDDDIGKESAEVVFEGFGEWSLDISVSYCVPQGGETAKIVRQRISLAIMRAIKSENLRLAVPTREIMQPSK